MNLFRKFLNIISIENNMLKDNRLAKSISTRAWMAGLINKYLILRINTRILDKTYEKYLSILPYQKKLIQNKQFDILIILDACRYDIFENIVWDYLDGELIAVRSPASVTIDWLRETWSDRKWNDIVYVSASPMVNKRGLIHEFDARKHFYDIIEVWDRGWDEKLSTVPPSSVNIATKLAITKYRLRGKKPGKDYRMVIHYVQPHAPYIKFKKITELITRSPLANDIADIALRREGKLAGKFAIDYIILAILKDSLHSTDKVNKALRRAYIENLRWVLSYVSKIVTNLDAKIVITADHGELLGEYGLYFHMTLPLPHLRIVPWFRVK